MEDQATTIRNMHKKFVENRPCSFKVMLADRTDRQTYSSQYSTPLPGRREVINQSRLVFTIKNEETVLHNKYDAVSIHALTLSPYHTKTLSASSTYWKITLHGAQQYLKQQVEQHGTTTRVFVRVFIYLL